MGIFDTARRFIEEKVKPVVQRVKSAFQLQPTAPTATWKPQWTPAPKQTPYTPPRQTPAPRASLMPGATSVYTPPSKIRTAAPSYTPYTPPRQTPSITAAAQRALSSLSESIRGITQKSRESQFATKLRSTIAPIVNKPVAPESTLGRFATEVLSPFERGVGAGGFAFTGLEKKVLPKLGLQPRLPVGRKTTSPFEEPKQSVVPRASLLPGAESVYTPPYVETGLSRLSRLAGGLTGFAVGPGKLIAPFEAAIAAKVPSLAGPSLFARGGRKLLPAFVAEAGTSALLGPVQAVTEKRPISEAFTEQYVGGLAGRALIGIPLAVLGIRGKNNAVLADEIIKAARTSSTFEAFEKIIKNNFKASDLKNVDLKGVFQKAKGVGGVKLYRGGEPTDLRKGLDEGIALSESKEVADYWRGSTKEGVLEEFQLSRDAKIYTPKKVPQRPTYQDKLREVYKAREAGYDVVDLTKFGESEMRVLNPDVLTQITKGMGDVEGTLFREKAEGGKLFAKKPVVPTPTVKAKIPTKQPVLDTLSSDFAKAREIRKTQTKTNIGQRLKSAFLDRFAAAEKVDDEFFMNLRLLAGGGNARADQIVKENMGPILTKEAARLKDFSSYMALQRLAELTNVRELERHLTPEQIGEGIIELERKVGPQVVREMAQSAKEFRGFLDEVLQMLVDAGVISKEAATLARQNNQYYITFETIGQMVRETGEAGIGFARRSFNMAQQDVFKGIGESKTGIADPLEATLTKVLKSIDTADKNSVLRDFARRNPDAIRLIPEGVRPGEGKGIINFFDNGVKVNAEVDEALAVAVKNLDVEPFNMATRIAAIPTKVLKAGAVTYNPGFFIVNPARDIQDALIVEGTNVSTKEAARLLSEYTSALVESSKMGDEWATWVKAGGSHSTFLRSEIATAPELTVKKLSEQGERNLSKRFLGVIKDPRKIFDYLSRTTEETTRLAKFGKDVGKGVDIGITPFAQVPRNIRQAAFESRNITLDFSRMGTQVRVLNQLIPFFNVGIQGSDKIINLIRTNPLGFGKSLAIYAGIPLTILYAHNRRFEDYKDIADWERERNIVFMIRDRTPEEIQEGKEIQAFILPKGNISQPFLNLWENFLRFTDDANPQNFGKLIANQIGELSPIGFPFGDQAGRMGSEITPQILKPIIESITNRNLYTGRDIVPYGLQGVEPREQYKDYTSPLAKFFGNILNWSPMKIENFFRTAGGAVGRGIIDPASLVGSTVGRFFGLRGGQQESDLFGKLREVEKGTKTESLQEKRQAQEIADGWGELPETEKDAVWAELPDDIKRRVKEILDKEAVGLTDFERSLKGSSVEARAKTVHQTIQEMEARGASSQEIDDLWNDYVQKKIITKDVRDAYQRILSGPEKTSAVQGGQGGVLAKAGEAVGEFVEQVNPFNPPAAFAADVGGDFRFVSGTPSTYRDVIIQASQETGIPTQVISALLKQESGFNPNAISSAGAIGIAQFMPGTARAMGINPRDPYQAIIGAARYLKQNLDKFGDMNLALAAYNAGPGAVSQYGGIPPFAETQNYVRSISRMMGDTTTHIVSPTAPSPSRDEILRKRNIERALGLPEGQYRKGLRQDQGDIDRAFRSNDQFTINLMREEGFKPSWEAEAPIQTLAPKAEPEPEGLESVIQGLQEYFGRLKERYGFL